MSKDARQAIALTDDAKEKIEECVAALAASGFGPDGPGKDTTFMEIEDYGHEVGRMIAQGVDERLAIRKTRGADCSEGTGNQLLSLFAG